MKVAFLAMAFGLVIGSQNVYGVPKQAWMTEVEAKLPAAICQTGYFKECFKVTPKECEKIAKTHSHQCLEQDKGVFPADFDATSGSQWGAKVGACSGGAVEKELLPKKIHNKKCDDPSAWMPK